MKLDETTYLILALRYKELFSSGGGGGGGDVPFEIDGYLTEIDTGKIDSDYMNSRFEKFLKTLTQDDVDEAEKRQTLDDLHKSFAMLTQEEQKYANIFLHDVESGNARMESGKTFRDYVTAYQSKAKSNQLQRISRFLGMNEQKLRNLMAANVTEASINEFGRFDDLKASVDMATAKAYFEKLENTQLPAFKVNIKVHNLLQAFILQGGFDIEEPNE